MKQSATEIATPMNAPIGAPKSAFSSIQSITAMIGFVIFVPSVVVGIIISGRLPRNQVYDCCRNKDSNEYVDSCDDFSSSIFVLYD